MIRIRDIKLSAGHGPGEMMDEIARIMCLDKIYPGNSYPDFSYEITRKSVDARKKPEIYMVYSVSVLIGEKDEKKILKYCHDNPHVPRIKKLLERMSQEPPKIYELPQCGPEPLRQRPVVIGSGPSGLFCALMLARRGFMPLLIERGKSMEKRTASVEKFWKTGELDPDSNVQFGEGGAGTFSDGKLTTLTKDAKGINSFVLRTFSEHGADHDILTDAKPHIGTDVLKNVVVSIRNEIISLGGEVRFETKLTGIVIKNDKISAVILESPQNTNETVEASACILCVGHSARDTFKMLYDLGVRMSAKNFAVGFRAVHPQKAVDLWQYGIACPEDMNLPSAEYKAAHETAKGRRVYTFCMCPGGYVVNASSEEGRLCVNGMSEHARDGTYANSAVIAAVTADDFIQDEVPAGHPLSGMYYQRRIEEEAFLRGAGSIPAERFSDFESGKNSGEGRCGTGAVKGSAVYADLRGILSKELDEAIIESIHEFGYTMKGFDDKDTMLFGIESRTSSPVRIERDESFQSNVRGLYPCGEGAGYAGGIVSAAADGIRCAEKLIGIYKYTEE